jgi:hypothetical protein
MNPVPKCPTWQERSAHLQWIYEHLVLCPEKEDGPFWVFALEYGRWLLDGAKYGMKWTVGYFPPLQDLLVLLESSKEDPQVTLEVRREILKAVYEVVRVNGYASMRFAHRGHRARPRSWFGHVPVA